jgi:hypothetical protein
MFIRSNQSSTSKNLKQIIEYQPFTDEAQTALFKDPVRTAL